MKQSSCLVRLLQLQHSVQMPLIQVWLALLLDGYEIEQKGEFYDLDGIWGTGQLTGEVIKPTQSQQFSN